MCAKVVQRGSAVALFESRLIWPRETVLDKRSRHGYDVFMNYNVATTEKPYVILVNGKPTPATKAEYDAQYNAAAACIARNKAKRGQK